MKPLVKAALAAFLVAFVIAVVLVAVHQSHVALRHRALTALQDKQKEIRALELRVANFVITYHDATAAGAKASQARHDRAMADADNSELLSLAKNEASSVTRAENVTQQMEDTSMTLAADYSDAGISSGTFQSESAARHDSCESALADWQRGIDDIKDSLKASISGDYPDDNAGVEGYYSASEHEDIQCDRRTSNVLSEMEKLEASLTARIRTSALTEHAF